MGKLSVAFRRKTFWFIDYLTSGSISSNLEKIKEINESDDESFVVEYQQQAMEKLFKHIAKKVPFYQGFDAQKIEDFPIINKSTIKENLPMFLSSPYKQKNLYRFVTSGSTGTPFVSYQDKRKKQQNTADTLYFSSLAGYEFAEPLFYLKIWGGHNRKSRLQQLMQNIFPVDVVQLTEGNIKYLIDEMGKKFSKAHVNSYASALEEICKYLDSEPASKANGNFNIGSIIAQSEALSHQTKERLHKYFDCLSCSRYSNIENGIIAQQTLENNDVFKVNRASYKLEILNVENDLPAEPGDFGRIVVTDLYNYAMPFVRYDTGDIGKFGVNNISGKIDFTYLQDIQGRMLDQLLDTKGNILSSFVMYKNMHKYTEIEQYQLIQENKKHYRFVISINKNFEREEEIKQEFIYYLGDDAEFDIEYVDEIPLLNSGKRRMIVNNYLKN